MSIQMLGIDHNRASVDVRALFSFTKKTSAAAMERLHEQNGINGCIILSTCNRMEIWLSTDDEWKGSILEELCKIKDVDPTEFGEYFISREDKEAVEHLFHLTCGLKSRIVGEDQIITQVKDALAHARDHYVTDNVLEVLFRTAVTAAKKVKTNVIFSRANVTAMDQAVALLREQGFDISKMICMIIGNGEMGKLAAQTMKKAGADVTVTVRQYRSGMVSIPRGCARIDYGKRMEYLPECDIVVSATASPNFTLTKELFQETSLNKPLILIDLAVPRDIDPAIGEMENLTLYDIDYFHLDMVGAHQKEAFAHAEMILSEQMEEFYKWYEGRDLMPRIQEIKEEVVKDFEPRIYKVLQKLPIEEEERKQLDSSIDKAVEKTVNKLIFGLKNSLSREQFTACMESLEKLYDE